MAPETRCGPARSATRTRTCQCVWPAGDCRLSWIAMASSTDRKRLSARHRRDLRVQCGRLSATRGRKHPESDLSDLEVLIVDDGSTDGCLSTIQDLHDPRIRILHQENQGKPAAMN